MSKDRRRNIRSRKSKRVILVSVEGKNKTEKNYINSFSSRERDFVIKVVPGNETDPINLVKQTIRKSKELNLDLEEDDKAYIVFDLDTNINKNKQIKEAIDLANQNNIIPIVSTPCIELWFLLHYEYTTATMNNDEVIKKLKKYCPKYEKNYNIYKEINQNTNTAIKNAKKLKKFQTKNHKNLQMVEVNPYTEMYKLIDEKKIKEKNYNDKFINVINALKEKDIYKLANNLYNTFEEVCSNKEIIQEIKNELCENGALGSIMTGSGSCILGIFDSKKQLLSAAQKIVGKYKTYVAKTRKFLE